MKQKINSATLSMSWEFALNWSGENGMKLERLTTFCSNEFRIKQVQNNYWLWNLGTTTLSRNNLHQANPENAMVFSKAQTV